MYRYLLVLVALGSAILGIVTAEDSAAPVDCSACHNVSVPGGVVSFNYEFFIGVPGTVEITAGPQWHVMAVGSDLDDSSQWYVQMYHSGGNTVLVERGQFSYTAMNHDRMISCTPDHLQYVDTGKLYDVAISGDGDLVIDCEIMNWYPPRDERDWKHTITFSSGGESELLTYSAGRG